MDVDLGALEDWASRRTPTTWVAFEANVQNQVPKPKRQEALCTACKLNMQSLTLAH